MFVEVSSGPTGRLLNFGIMESQPLRRPWMGFHPACFRDTVGSAACQCLIKQLLVSQKALCRDEYLAELQEEICKMGFVDVSVISQRWAMYENESHSGGSP
ncbi:hypothetical protein EAE96_010923 [Botrytis aclada]|nr:hypothetical protein EAE96_010923 [Botrytis aclada]